jgi:hypothetical protein
MYSGCSRSISPPISAPSFAPIWAQPPIESPITDGMTDVIFSFRAGEGLAAFEVPLSFCKAINSFISASVKYFSYTRVSTSR